MPTKIRLQRHGKKKYAYYHVVVADARAPRDGKFIEKLGSYNPNDNPATIDINFDRCLHWVKSGAQPTDTCKALLSYKGVMHKDHLDRGVLKGAMTQEQADKKFEAWMKEKESKVDSKKDGLAKAAADAEKARMAAETVANEKKAAEVLAKTSALAAEAAAVEAPAVEETTEAVTEEAPVAEEAVVETPAEEEAPAVEEAPVAETPSEEVPAAEENKTEE
jgi:small subunit ribosomal protein S16